MTTGSEADPQKGQKNHHLFQRKLFEFRADFRFSTQIEGALDEARRVFGKHLLQSIGKPSFLFGRMLKGCDQRDLNPIGKNEKLFDSFHDRLFRPLHDVGE
jgi:hypothetical protein